MSPHVQQLAERFMRYVQIDTQSDPFSESFPSTEKQKDLCRLLVEELKAIGLKDAYMDEHGYVFARISGNSPKNNIPAVCFCSHVDTAPDCSGTNVKPLLHLNYQGAPIILPDDPTQVLTTEQHPYLKERLGCDLITASGNTLLGADDKAGVAIIMQLAKYLSDHPEILHGDIQILFTPDEEVGRGVEKLDMKKVNATVGYTLDGGPIGSIEGDTFSANAFRVVFHGVSAHPGYAKGKMVNAMKVLSSFIDSLPSDHLCPEATSGAEGFVHPTHVEGGLERALVDFIIRDFKTEKLSEYQDFLIKLAQDTIKRFPGSTFNTRETVQYRNMREVLQHHPEIEENAREAMKRIGIEPKTKLVRGGTDGSRLSFMGLPCPNLFTGEMAIHGKQEYVFVQDMEMAMLTLAELVQIYEQKA